MPRIINLNPGPVHVPDFVMEAIARPVIHHRSPAFRSLFAEIQKGLQYLFQTEGPVIGMCGSGTMGVQAALASVIHPGDKLLIPAFGKFSDRWSAFISAAGPEVVEVKKEWGQRPSTEEIIAQVRQHSDLRIAVLTHCETSTGVDIDLEEICFELRQVSPEILILVDGISSIGAIPFYFDAWQVDLAIIASQKTLLNPTGTAFTAMSQRAIDRLNRQSHHESGHLSTYLQALKEGTFPFTAPTQLFYGVKAALDHIRDKGLPACWNGSHAMSQWFKTAVQDLGAQLLGESDSDALTVFSFPGKDNGAIRQALIENHSIEVASGQGLLARQVMRVAHFGDIGMEEMERCINGLREIG